MILQSVEKYVIVNTYSNCENAIANLKRDALDIVLIDIQLPRISGVEGTIRIRKKLPNCIILIIAVSEDNDQVFKRRRKRLYYQNSRSRYD